MVFFGQLREAELDVRSAPLLALKSEEHEQQIQEAIIAEEENDERRAE